MQVGRDAVRREQRLCVAGMEVASLKMKSSHQLKECLAFPHNPSPQEYDGPVYTRTMLLARRRIEKEHEEARGHDNFMRTFGVTAR